MNKVGGTGLKNKILKLEEENSNRLKALDESMLKRQKKKRL